MDWVREKDHCLLGNDENDWTLNPIIIPTPRSILRIYVQSWAGTNESCGGKIKNLYIRATRTYLQPTIQITRNPGIASQCRISSEVMRCSQSCVIRIAIKTPSHFFLHNLLDSELLNRLPLRDNTGTID
jgi:hypothetical protein